MYAGQVKNSNETPTGAVTNFGLAFEGTELGIANETAALVVLKRLKSVTENVDSIMLLPRASKRL